MNFSRNNNEDGFVLVVTLVILVMLTLLGLAGTRTTTTEIKISGNDKLAKQTFYQADGATEAGIEMIELNVACPLGFAKAGTGFDDDDPSTSFSIYGVDIFDSTFMFDDNIDQIAFDSGSAYVGTAVALAEMPSIDARTLRITATPMNPDAPPTTNLAIFGVPALSTGSAILLAAGYEGRAKAAAALGAFINYAIHSQHRELANAESIVRLDWQHLIGTEGAVCQY